MKFKCPLCGSRMQSVVMSECILNGVVYADTTKPRDYSFYNCPDCDLTIMKKEKEQ